MLIDVRTAMIRTRTAIHALGGDVAVFEIGPVATSAQLDTVERRIAREIPPALRRLFLEQSATLRMFWTIENRQHGPKSLRSDLAGSIDLSLLELPTDLLNWSGWRAAFEYPAEHGLSPDLTVQDYEELFPVVVPANGDQIVVVDPERNPSDAVMYLNHEADDFNFVILSDSLEEFLNTWFQLGCIGPEWWALAPFFDEETLKISLNTRRSQTWLRTLAADG
jgi:hypothetical protein